MVSPPQTHRNVLRRLCAALCPVGSPADQKPHQSPQQPPWLATAPSKEQFLMSQTAPFDLRRALDALSLRDIVLPKPVAEAVTLWQEITASRPAEPSTEALRDLVIAKAGEAELGAALLLDLGSARLQTAWSTACTTTASRALALILEHADEIFDQLAVLAEGLIADLVRVAEIGDTPLNTLVREGRHDEARLVADVDRTAAELNELFDIVQRSLTTRSLTVNGYNCSKFSNGPEVASHIRGNVTEALLSGVRGGGVLYFPRPAEAIENAQRYWDEYAAAEAERQRELYGVGSTVGWS